MKGGYAVGEARPRLLSSNYSSCVRSLARIKVVSRVQAGSPSWDQQSFSRHTICSSSLCRESKLRSLLDSSAGQERLEREEAALCVYKTLLQLRETS